MAIPSRFGDGTMSAQYGGQQLQDWPAGVDQLDPVSGVAHFQAQDEVVALYSGTAVRLPAALAPLFQTGNLGRAGAGTGP